MSPPIMDRRPHMYNTVKMKGGKEGGTEGGRVS